MSSAAKAVGGAILALVVIAAIMLIGVYGFGWFERSTANYRGGTSQINKVLGNGDYRIAAYDAFYDQCAAIQTDEDRVSRSRAALRRDANDPQQEVIDHATLDAQLNQRDTDINQYNADARKADTKAHFRASDLPYQIEQTGRTTCTAD